MIDIISKKSSRGIMQQNDDWDREMGRKGVSEVNMDYGVPLFSNYSVQEWNQWRSGHGMSFIFVVVDRVSCSHKWIHPIEPASKKHGAF